MNKNDCETRLMQEVGPSIVFNVRQLRCFILCE